MLLIGSRAAARLGLNLNRNKPSDYDVIGSKEELATLVCDIKPTSVIANRTGSKVVLRTSKTIIEFEVTWPDSTAAKLVELVGDGGPTIETAKVPDLGVLYALKLSHRFAPQKAFLKTMTDIRTMRSLGAAVPAELTEWLAVRQKETLRRHHRLNVSKAEFFDINTVPYVYDHDSLHEAVKIRDYPAYKDILIDGADVMCDRHKFERLPLERKLDTVIEETSVLALERSVIHHHTDPLKAFTTSLKHVCTNITSGWWREFAWENYQAVLDRYDPAYITKFEAARDTGQLLPFSGKTY